MQSVNTARSPRLLHRGRLAAGAGLLGLLLVLAGCSNGTTPGQAQAAAPESKGSTSTTIRIGYQKFGTLNILKARGTLEKRVESQGTTVKWVEFPAGPQLLEALNTGSIDIGTTGEAPPIFAQAAGTPLVYVANNPGSPAGEAIIVPKTSPIQKVADLKGKKVALNKGSNVHYLLVRALEAAGLKYSDIRPVFLPPADARAAFEGGSVDAWVIWDPFLAAAQRQTGARTIQDGTGLVANRGFYFATRAFATGHPDLVNALVEELRTVEQSTKANPAGVAKELSPQVQIDAPTLEVVLRRQVYGVDPITPAVVTDQQKIADAFYHLKLIPRHIQVADATLGAGK